MNIIPMINCSTKSNRTPPSLPLPLTLSLTLSHSPSLSPSPTHPLCRRVIGGTYTKCALFSHPPSLSLSLTHPSLSLLSRILTTTVTQLITQVSFSLGDLRLCPSSLSNSVKR